MKKYLLVALLITPLLSSGQFRKGDKFIGGSFQFTSQHSKSGQVSTYEYKTFSVYPAIGFLVSEKFAFGGQLGYSYYTTVSNANQPFRSEYKSKGVVIGATARRYFSISEKFVFAINGILDFTRGSESNNYSITSGKTQNYRLSSVIRPYFLFFPSPRWGFEASPGAISYSYTRNLSSDSHMNFVNADYGNFYLGVSYYFRNEK